MTGHQSRTMVTLEQAFKVCVHVEEQDTAAKQRDTHQLGQRNTHQLGLITAGRGMADDDALVRAAAQVIYFHSVLAFPLCVGPASLKRTRLLSLCAKGRLRPRKPKRGC